MAEPCQCEGPGHCPRRGVEVTGMGWRVCQSGDDRSIASYFAGPDLPSLGRMMAGAIGTAAAVASHALSTGRVKADGTTVARRLAACRHGQGLPADQVVDGHCANYRPGDGRCGLMTGCGCVVESKARLEAAACPRGWWPGPGQPPATVEIQEGASMGELPVRMVAPGDRRPVWRGGIVQIMVTRACDLSCHHCTQGSNLGGKPVVMTPDEFDRACASLEGYWGVVGMFGGNPAMHPQFETLCEIMRGRFPFEQRGIWCNNPRGKAGVMRVTFNPAHSNLNVHLDSGAHAEFARDWPECQPYLKGLDRDSEHGSPWVALRDVVPDEAERWRLIGDCDINKYWSALVGVVPTRGLRAYFCEIAYTQAAMHATADDAADWPDTGLPVEPGWWRRPIADFEAQVRLHCHACGIPLRRPGQLAIGGQLEEFSETHRAIARPKAKGRPVQIVETIGLVERPARPATEYLPGTTPKVHA